MEEVAALVGAFDAADGVAEGGFGEFAGHAGVGGPAAEAGAQSVGGAGNGEFAEELGEGFAGEGPPGGSGEDQVAGVAELARLGEDGEGLGAERYPVAVCGSWCARRGLPRWRCSCRFRSRWRRGPRRCGSR